MSGVVEKASASTGTAAVESLRKSLSGFSDLIVRDVDMKPAITPVLDLSSIKKDAGQIGGILGAKSISIDAAYVKAKAVSEDFMSSRPTDPQGGDRPAVGSVTYNQYNNSPKALSSAEIYRQTKNQLSVAKGALATSANQSRS
jgi:hypothetical protein